MSTDKPSIQVIEQRTRNRIIEHLELVSSFEDQRKYEANVPIANVPAEIFCGWDDWVRDENINCYGPPVFSDEEMSAMKQFHNTSQSVVDDLPDRRLTLSEAQKLDEWERLRRAAEQTLAAFSRRGKLSEDVEI